MGFDSITPIPAIGKRDTIDSILMEEEVISISAGIRISTKCRWDAFTLD
jgi:hypothetical protein